MSPDYDVIVIGSGFGGSVTALRLSEKGYRVGVLEQGARWRPQDYPPDSVPLRETMWQPRFGLFGPLQEDSKSFRRQAIHEHYDQIASKRRAARRRNRGPGT